MPKLKEPVTFGMSQRSHDYTCLPPLGMHPIMTYHVKQSSSLTCLSLKDVHWPKGSVLLWTFPFGELYICTVLRTYYTYRRKRRVLNRAEYILYIPT